LGPNVENVMHHPERWTFDWFYKRHDMDKADNRFYRQTETERRAAELHEGCQMPLEQARELAASEASQDWYARGQDWGLADALTNGQSGDWVLDDIARAFAAGAEAKTTMKVEISQDPEMLRRAMAAETEVALLRAALDQKHAEYEDLKRCAANNTRNQGLKIETLLRGINDARALIDPIWRHRMGAEQVREHVQRGLRCIDSAITDCRFTEPPTVHDSDCAGFGRDRRGDDQRVIES
jgi:hypothetical protein